MFFRMIFGLPGAALVTALLFVAMALMVRQDTQIVDQFAETPKIEILAKLESTPPRTMSPRPEPINPPPLVEIILPAPSAFPEGTIPTEIVPGPKDKGGKLDFPASMQPTVRIPPPYPDICRARGAQGVVIVEFDVTAEGTVVNPRIVSSDNECLDRTVLNTIQKWKYSPRQDSSGRPIPQRGLREFFNFQLTE